MTTTATVPLFGKDLFAGIGLDLDDPQYLPSAGDLTSDQEAYVEAKRLLADLGGGVDEEGQPEDFPPGVGAAISVVLTKEETYAPFVLLREGLADDLRADLLSFAIAAVSVRADEIAAQPDGFLAVGIERQVVRGPGVGLLATLMARRVGRNTGSASFLTFGPSS
jgi:hypothetical protein